MRLTLERRRPDSTTRGFGFTVEFVCLSVTLRFWLHRRPGWWKFYDHVDNCVLLPTRKDVRIVIRWW